MNSYSSYNFHTIQTHVLHSNTYIVLLHESLFHYSGASVNDVTQNLVCVLEFRERFPYNPYIYYACRIINYVRTLLFLKSTGTPKGIEYISTYCMNKSKASLRLRLFCMMKYMHQYKQKR